MELECFIHVLPMVCKTCANGVPFKIEHKLLVAQVAFRRRWPAVREECTAKHQAKHIVAPAVGYTWIYTRDSPPCVRLLACLAKAELLSTNARTSSSARGQGHPHSSRDWFPLCTSFLPISLCIRPWYRHLVVRVVNQTAGGGIGRRKARAACSATWRSSIFAMGGPRWPQHVKAIGCTSIVHDEVMINHDYTIIHRYIQYVYLYVM